MTELRVVLVTVATCAGSGDAGALSGMTVSRDVALNCDVPTSRLVPLLRDVLGRPVGDRESAAETAHWSLAGADGSIRSGQTSLRQFGVLDGDVLVLRHDSDPDPVVTAEVVR